MNKFPYIFVVFFPFAFGYFLSYLFRSVNAIISPVLISEFHLTASELGLLTSVYFVSFAFFQIPIGVMLDKYGPRLVNAIFLIFAGIGSIFFGMSENLLHMILARICIGAGVAAALMSSIKAFSLWFPLKRLPQLNSWVMFFGGLGAIFATAPTEFIVSSNDWRFLFHFLGFLTFICAILILTIVPKNNSNFIDLSFFSYFSEMKNIFWSRKFWTIVFYASLFPAVNVSILTLWAGPWFFDVMSLENDMVAKNLLFIAIATTLGFLFWGNYAAKLNEKGISYWSVFKLGIGFYLFFQLLIILGIKENSIFIWIAWSFFGASGSLAFSIIVNSFPVKISGRVTSAYNFMIFLLSFIIQWTFGLVLDLFSDESNRYSDTSYFISFSVFFFLQLFIFISLLRNKNIATVKNF